MIRIDVPQRSPEWIAARIGIPTASQFHRIITPKTLKPSAQVDGYVHELLAEWALGASLTADLPMFATDMMDRGTALEPSAVEFYEFTRDLTTEQVGFCLTDGGEAGCSPDRLVGEDGGLECKCPSPAVHIASLLGEDPEKHKAQIQGCLWVTGRKWWDRMSYHPDLPPAIVRFERDEAFIAALAEAVAGLNERLREGRARLMEMGIRPLKAAA